MYTRGHCSSKASKNWSVSSYNSRQSLLQNVNIFYVVSTSSNLLAFTVMNLLAFTLLMMLVFYTLISAGIYSSFTLLDMLT